MRKQTLLYGRSVGTDDDNAVRMLFEKTVFLMWLKVECYNSWSSDLDRSTR
jgi:hypothetical protein